MHDLIGHSVTVLGCLDQRADIGPTWRGGPRIFAGRVGNCVEVAVTDPDGTTQIADFHIYRTEAAAKAGFQNEVNRREQDARLVLAAFPPIAVDVLETETRYDG